MGSNRGRDGIIRAGVSDGGGPPSPFPLTTYMRVYMSQSQTLPGEEKKREKEELAVSQWGRKGKRKNHLFPENSFFSVEKNGDRMNALLF